MSSVTQQIETVTIMAVAEHVSVMVSYKSGSNSISHMTPQEVLREFGSYLTATDRQRLIQGTDWVHKHKHKICAIL